MKYREIADGIFVDRPNRFIAHVKVNGAVETVHVKNTGRCRELLLPGTAVRLEVSDNPKRKTKYDLVAVHKQGLGWVNMDSQAPNKMCIRDRNNTYVKERSKRADALSFCPQIVYNQHYKRCLLYTSRCV